MSLQHTVSFCSFIISSQNIFSLYSLSTVLCAAAASQTYLPSVISCIFIFLSILEIGVKAPDEDTDVKPKQNRSLLDWLK